MTPKRGDHAQGQAGRHGHRGLVAVSLLLAVNQIVVKHVTVGLQPVFFAGPALGPCRRVRRRRGSGIAGSRGGSVWPTSGPGLLMGALFAAEFLCLFLALDLTTVGRSALIMYSMPVWMGILAHFLLPGERMTATKAAGLALAFGGTAVGDPRRKPDGGHGQPCWAIFARWWRPGAGPGPPVWRASHGCAQAGPRCSCSGWSWSRPRSFWRCRPSFGPLIRDLQPVPLGLARVPVLGRGGGGLHRLALAFVGLSRLDRCQLFLPDPDLRHSSWPLHFWRIVVAKPHWGGGSGVRRKSS